MNSLADFSCAFVSDILLQGFLYITKNHIAFYSNVFGYITKLLIPFAAVARISKEKTVKIIPNAIAVATIDERHVFSSFLSREAAYQLMVGVWKEALPMCDIYFTSSAAKLVISTVSCKKYTVNPTTDVVPIGDYSYSSKAGLGETHAIPNSNTLQVHHQKRILNSGASEMENESSSAISGNESLSQLVQTAQLIYNKQVNNDGSSSNSNLKCEVSSNRDSNSELDTSKTFINNAEPATSASNSIGLIDKSKSTLNEMPIGSIFKLEIPRTIHIAYFALSLTIILALIAAFLFYRISELKNSRFKPFPVDEMYKVNVLLHNIK